MVTAQLSRSDAGENEFTRERQMKIMFNDAKMFDKTELPTIDKVVHALNVLFPEKEMYVSVINTDIDRMEKRYWSGDSTVRALTTEEDGNELFVWIIPDTLVPAKANEPDFNENKAAVLAAMA